MVTDKERLERLRERLEVVLEDPATTPRDLATCSREYRLLLEQLGGLSTSDSSSVVDEIAARRQKRMGS